MAIRLKNLIALSLALAPLSPALAADESRRWGDLGDGTFANPVLNADYSDPDIIRVGDKYYLTCSEFHFMGMPILESDDMVNWRIIGQV
ncbi:MAG: family 43 glycosylhydrolase, partial [Duncaniella sp.]|nr:family 43 glycosylhydrolase [Duncaniella sp.]